MFNKFSIKKFFFFLLIFQINFIFSREKIDDEKFSKILPLFENYLNQTFLRSKVPGAAIAIVDDKGIKFVKCLGVKKIGGDDLVDENTMFQLASVSKSFTATLVADQVYKKHLSFADRVIDLDNSFRLYDNYTTMNMNIIDLLAHRSGLPSHSGNVLLSVFNYPQEEVYYRLRFLKPEYSFREKYTYQNYLFSKAGFIAAKLAKKSFPSLMKEVIFTPLNMKSTTASFFEFLKSKNKVTTHILVDGKIKPQSYFNPDDISPAGGISSTILDMSNFLMMQINDGEFLGKRVIDRNSLLFTRQPHAITHKDAFGQIPLYGLGWLIKEQFGEKFILHEGAFEKGVSTFVGFFPSKKIGIIILTNSLIESFAPSIALKFFELYIKGKSEVDYFEFFSDKKKIDKCEKNCVDRLKEKLIYRKPLALKNYEGSFENNYYGEVKILEKNGNLYAIFGKNPIKSKLVHVNGDVFETKEGWKLFFTIDNQNKAIKLFIEDFNFDGRDGNFNNIKGQS